jgi:hypothetical protein
LLTTKITIIARAAFEILLVSKTITLLDLVENFDEPSKNETV